MRGIKFDNNGELERGYIHTCSGEEFLNTFCLGPHREDYKNAVVNVFDFAKDRGARRIFIGGSFITSKEYPRDFDCLIVFNQERDIPDFIDSSIIGDIQFDILFASEDYPQTVDAFLDLFQSERNGMSGKPIVEVLLDSRIEEWKIHYTPDMEEKEIIKKAYINRTIIQRRKVRGVLFTIHGVNTNAYWNSKFAPLACSQGWIFAPFIYKNPIWLLFRPSLREKVVKEFNDYFYEIAKKYEITSASIVAHSFGTYILAKYLLNHEYEEFLPISIDSVVLAGSIVSREYNWLKYTKKIGRILNISSPNDRWVKLMPKCSFLKKRIMREKDGIFGRIGYTGINDHKNYINNREIPMLKHCNVFEDEVLERVYMPFLNSNIGGVTRRFIKDLRHR